MKEFVVKLQSGDTLLRSDDPCLVLRVVYRVRDCMVVHRPSNTLINTEILSDLCSEYGDGG